MPNKTFQVPAILEGVNPLKDGGMSLRWHTQELTDGEKLILLGFYQKFGHLLFRANKFKEEEIPKDDAPRDETKTPSQRLRSIIFVLSQQRGIKKEDFDDYYRKTMEKLIEQFKGKLEL